MIELGLNLPSERRCAVINLCEYNIADIASTYSSILTQLANPQRPLQWLNYMDRWQVQDLPTALQTVEEFMAMLQQRQNSARRLYRLENPSLEIAYAQLQHRIPLLNNGSLLKGKDWMLRFSGVSVQRLGDGTAYYDKDAHEWGVTQIKGEHSSPIQLVFAQ